MKNEMRNEIEELLNDGGYEVNDEGWMKMEKISVENPEMSSNDVLSMGMYGEVGQI